MSKKSKNKNKTKNNNPNMGGARPNNPSQSQESPARETFKHKSFE